MALLRPLRRSSDISTMQSWIPRPVRKVWCFDPPLVNEDTIRFTFVLPLLLELQRFFENLLIEMIDNRSRYCSTGSLPSPCPRAPQARPRGRSPERLRQAQRCLHGRDIRRSTQGQQHHLDSARPLGAPCDTARGRPIRRVQDKGCS